MRILNYGSLNIDHVYRVPHISVPGETLSSESYETFAGGKGANQSVALARAGADVAHAGKIGPDDTWLRDKLASAGVDVTFTRTGESPTGHAVIQVADDGRNSIVLYPGSNRQISREEINDTLGHFHEGDMLLLQNEISNVPYLLAAGSERAMEVCFNPAPYSEDVRDMPLHSVDILIVNEIEGRGLSGEKGAEAIVERLSEMLSKASIVLTLGEAGVMYRDKDESLAVPAVPAKAVDTTAAGDTFIGYYLASRAAGKSARACLEKACAAAAACVSHKGAMDSIPRM